jgi:hypothetical protein
MALLQVDWLYLGWAMWAISIGIQVGSLYANDAELMTQPFSFVFRHKNQD